MTDIALVSEINQYNINESHQYDTIYIYIYINRICHYQNLQSLIYYKTQPANETNSQGEKRFIVFSMDILTKWNVTASSRI